MNCWPSSSWCVCLRWIRCALAIETVMKNVRKSSFSSLFNKRLIEWRFRKESKEHLILLCVVLCRLAPDNAWPLFQTWYLRLFFGHLLLDLSIFFLSFFTLWWHVVLLSLWLTLDPYKFHCICSRLTHEFVNRILKCASVLLFIPGF